MALQKTIIKNIYGQTITIENAYMKITQINGNKDRLKFTLTTFNKNKVDTIESDSFSFIPDVSSNAKNFIQQGYEHLKTLDEFKDAVDVLDEGQIA